MTEKCFLFPNSLSRKKAIELNRKLTLKLVLPFSDHLYKLAFNNCHSMDSLMQLSVMNLIKKRKTLKIPRLKNGGGGENHKYN